MTETSQAKVLIIEDEPEIAGYLRRGLIMEGFSVDVAADGLSGVQHAREQPPDVIVLDLMLPGIDGFEVLQRIRSAMDVAIIILTARDDVPSRVTGLERGADDYLVKPFAFEELLARIRVQLRRKQSSTQGNSVLRYADLVLDTRTRDIFVGEHRIDLTPKEYDLLELFLRNPEQVLSRDVIYDRIWGYDFGGESNILEVYVRYLRTKLDVGNGARLIRTVRGIGYMLRDEGNDVSE